VKSEAEIRKLLDVSTLALIPKLKSRDLKSPANKTSRRKASEARYATVQE
jgi:hypothetical protein